MPDEFDLFLCGGILFALLTKFVKRGTSSSEKWTGKSDSVSHPRLMKRLVEVALDKEQAGQGEYFTSVQYPKQAVGRYRSCQLESYGYMMPFCMGDPYLSFFEDNITNSYSSVVARMKDFLDFCIPATLKENRKNLVNTLIAVIEDDKSIDDSQEFLIGPTGEAVTKSGLLEMKELCFESFITGIWHFCICQRSGMNKQGRRTFDWLFEESASEGKNRQGSRNIPLRESFVENAKRGIEFMDWEEAVKNAEEILKQVQSDLKGKLNTDSQAGESVEAEFVDERDRAGKSKNDSASKNSGGVTIVVGDQFNANGPITHYTNTGTITINNNFR